MPGANAAVRVVLKSRRRRDDERPAVTNLEPKSSTRATTFPHDLHPHRDRASLGEVFTAPCGRIAGILQRKGYMGRAIAVKLHFKDFLTVTRDLTLPGPTADPAFIRRAAGECLRVPARHRVFRHARCAARFQASGGEQRSMSTVPRTSSVRMR